MEIHNSVIGIARKSFVLLGLLCLGCQMNTVGNPSISKLRKERSWEAIEACCKHLDINTNILEDSGEILFFALKFPIPYREEWSPDSRLLLWFEDRGTIPGTTFGTPNIEMARELTKDFKVQNGQPTWDSNILPWIFDQAEGSNVPLLVSEHIEEEFIKDYTDPIYSFSEVGFSRELSEAVIYFECTEENGAFGAYFYLKWNEEQSVYEILAERLDYIACGV